MTTLFPPPKETIMATKPPKKVKAGYKGAPKKGGEGGSPFKPGDTIVVAKRTGKK